MSRIRGAATAMALSALVGLAGAVAGAQYAPGRITVADLKKLYDAGGVIVLDVRAEEAYRDSHITGALSVPLDQVTAKAPGLAKAGKPLVTYCT